MWTLLPIHQPYIYDFTFNSDGYSLIVSDIHHVWAERLDKSQVISRARSSDCVLVVTNGPQVASLAAQLEKSLQNDEGTISISAPSSTSLTISISHPIPDIDSSLDWSFDLNLENAEAQLNVFSILCTNLLGALDSVSRHSSKLESLLVQKDYHIKHMHTELASAGGKYSPRKFRNSVGTYKDTKGAVSWNDEPFTVIQRALKVANRHWGFSLESSRESGHTLRPKDRPFLQSLIGDSSSRSQEPSSQDTWQSRHPTLLSEDDSLSQLPSQPLPGYLPQSHSLLSEVPLTQTDTESGPPQTTQGASISADTLPDSAQSKELVHKIPPSKSASPLLKTDNAHDRKRALQKELDVKKERIRKKPRF